jgi:maltose/moltooligosaccharide transporter
MEPFRAFVGDNLPSTQRTTGFAMQSFFIGVGAVVGSLLPWILTNWFGAANTAPEHHIPQSVRLSYYLTAAIFLAAVLWTVLRSKEYSPEEMASFQENQAREAFARARRTAAEYAENGGRQIRVGALLVLLGIVASFWVLGAQAGQVIVLSAGAGVVGVLLIVGGRLQRAGRYDSGFITILNDFQDMPPTMKQLAWVQFFTWFALYSMWIYTTPGVTEHIYHTTDTSSALFNEGANWVGFCFGAYSFVAALVAFAIPVLARATSRKLAHAICLVLGAAGLLSIWLITDRHWLLGSMVGVGIAWASILAMPYAILTGSLPPSKLGYYMGVFNYFIVIPQIVAAAVLGFSGVLSKTAFAICSGWRVGRW